MTPGSVDRPPREGSVTFDQDTKVVLGKVAEKEARPSEFPHFFHDLKSTGGLGDRCGVSHQPPRAMSRVDEKMGRASREQREDM